WADRVISRPPATSCGPRHSRLCWRCPFFRSCYQHYESSLALRAQISGEQNYDYGVGLLNLGDLEREQGKFDLAEALYTNPGRWRSWAEDPHEISRWFSNSTQQFSGL